MTSRLTGRRAHQRRTLLYQVLLLGVPLIGLLALGLFTSGRERGTPEAVGKLARVHHERIERELSSRSEASVWRYTLRQRASVITLDEGVSGRALGQVVGVVLIWGVIALLIVSGSRPSLKASPKGLAALILITLLMLALNAHLLSARVTWRWDVATQQATRQRASLLWRGDPAHLSMRGATLRPILEVVEDAEDGTTLYSGGWWLNPTQRPPVRKRLWREGTWWPILTGPRDARAEGLALCWALAARIKAPCEGGDAAHIPLKPPATRPRPIEQATP